MDLDFYYARPPKRKPPDPNSNRTVAVQVGPKIWIMIEPGQNPEAARNRYLRKMKEQESPKLRKNKAALQRKNEELSNI